MINTHRYHRSDLKDIPFFYNGEIEGKFIEVIWNSGREIKAWNPVTQKGLPLSPPFVFLSNEDPATLLPANVQSNYHIE